MISLPFCSLGRAVVLSPTDWEGRLTSMRYCGRTGRVFEYGLRLCEVALMEPPFGIYAVHEGLDYESPMPSGSFEDYGPTEFATNFHSLAPHQAMNQIGLQGPVVTFSDLKFGLPMAIENAADDLAERIVRSAAVLFYSKEPEIFLCFVSPRAESFYELARDWTNQPMSSIVDSLGVFI